MSVHPEHHDQQSNKLRSGYGLDFETVIEELTKLKEEAGKKPFKTQSKGHVPTVRIKGCYFWKLPHENGFKFNVGSPITESFYSKIEEGKLSSGKPEHCMQLMRKTKIMSYWRSNRERICSQLPVYFKAEEVHPWIDMSQSKYVSEDKAPTKFGAIMPQVIVAGTVTRRSVERTWMTASNVYEDRLGSELKYSYILQVIVAGTVTRRSVERTWMTASNVYEDRLGSELKGIIQPPPGFCFVGADVDSEELWIAAVLGDRHQLPVMHGSTSLGWMVLQGSKAEGTDQHSVVAKKFGISRDHAKLLNYARLYGSGERFAGTALLKYNPSLNKMDANKLAGDLLAFTKGQKKYTLKSSLARGSAFDSPMTFLEMKEIARMERRELGDISDVHYVGGTESDTFNAMERMAKEQIPVTPVLHARMSASLQPRHVDDMFPTSRVNWVVQSSAVDYLHLMLCTMKDLCERYDIPARLSLTVHDAAYYMVREEDKYRCALALQFANLFTRAMFAQKLGFDNLPLSVAFFSEVNIDYAMRKDATKDDVTPTNPEGLMGRYGVPKGQNVTMEMLLQSCTSLEK